MKTLLCNKVQQKVIYTIKKRLSRTFRLKTIEKAKIKTKKYEPIQCGKHERPHSNGC